MVSTFILSLMNVNYLLNKTGRLIWVTFCIEVPPIGSEEIPFSSKTLSFVLFFFLPFTPFCSFLLFGLTELNCINYYFQRLFLLSPDIDKAVDILRHSFYDFLPLIFGQMFNIFSVVV